MLTELKTLSRQEPQFQDYMLGTFSETHRALPVGSLNVRGFSEQITFRILKKEDLVLPLWPRRLMATIKIKSFPLIFLPLLLVYVESLLRGTAKTPLLGLVAALGAWALQIGMQLLNDFQDHMQGLDCVHPRSGSKAIQKGWVRAFQIKRLAYLFIVVGVFLGLPAIYFHSELLIIAGSVLLLGYQVWKSETSGLKYRTWTEISVFFMFGPLLTLGFQFSLGAEFGWKILFLGLLTGALTVFTLHLKHFEQLMVNSKARFENSMSKRGFEKAKYFLKAEFAVFLTMFAGYHFLYAPSFWFLSAVLVGFSLIVIFIRSLWQIRSPVGSSMVQSLRISKMLVGFLICFWLLESSWYLWRS